MMVYSKTRSTTLVALYRKQVITNEKMHRQRNVMQRKLRVTKLNYIQCWLDNMICQNTGLWSNFEELRLKMLDIYYDH